MKGSVWRYILFFLVLFGMQNVSAQEKSIKGVVTDENDDPLPGVNITVKDSDAGTQTDFDGEYSLEVEKGEKLIFSFVGFQGQTKTIGDEDTIDVIMEEGEQSLEEVVVNVGYGTKRESDLTGAVSTIKGDDALKNRPITDLGSGLQGKIPNLQISSQGAAPGQGSNFNIRGFTSINGGEPLVLVDGVEQDPNSINPNDVEDVSVLKDASAAAIYGSRAAYGVILITTKSGKKETAPEINISTSYSINDMTVQPEYVDSKNYMDYLDEANKNAGSGNYIDDRIRSAAEAYYQNPADNEPVIYDPDIDTDGKYEYVGNTDWAKALYEKGSLLQNNVSIRGGSEKTTYYLSYGRSRKEGFLSAYDDSYQKHNINLNTSVDVADWLEVSGRIKYTYSKEDHPSGGKGANSGISAYTGLLKNDLKPLLPIRHPDGNFSGQGDITNPFAVGAEGGHDQTKINDLVLTGAAVIKPTKDLNINVDYTFKPFSSNNELTSRNFKEFHADGSSNIYPWTNPNLVRLENHNDYHHIFNVYGDYSKSFGDHNLKLMLGYNHEIKKLKSFSAERTNLISNDLPAINKASGKKDVDGAISSWALLGGFFRLNYDYNDKYILELNGRYDGSSKFPSNDRYVFSPSISGAWKVSEEDFWEGSRLSGIFDEVKINGSYGQLANQDVGGNFPYLSTYNVNSELPYILGSSSDLPVSVAPGGLVSPSFTWEKVKQWDIGLDLELLDNRLKFSFDYYNRNTNGMLTKGRPLPAILGTAVPEENVADLSTKGWEFSIDWHDQINQDLSYNASVNLSNSKAHITKFDNPTKLLDEHYVGEEIGEIWGYEADGLFQSEEEVEDRPDQSELYSGTWRPGDVRYVDQNDDEKITNGDNTLENHGDLKKIGNTEPHYLIGLNGGVSWKNFDFSFFFQGVLKQDIVPGGRYYGIDSQWDVPMVGALDHWSENNKNGFLPRPYIDGGHGNRGGNSGAVDRYLLNASYVRLKQATLSYTFSNDWLENLHIDNFQLYFTGENLFTFTSLPKKLYDPENADPQDYPVAKTYSFGVNITL